MVEGQRRMPLKAWPTGCWLAWFIYLSLVKVIRSQSFATPFVEESQRTPASDTSTPPTAEQCLSVQRRTSCCSPSSIALDGNREAWTCDSYRTSARDITSRLVIWKLFSSLCARKFVFYCTCLISERARACTNLVYGNARRCARNVIETTRLSTRPISRKIHEFLTSIFTSIYR